MTADVAISGSDCNNEATSVLTKVPVGKDSLVAEDDFPDDKEGFVSNEDDDSSFFVFIIANDDKSPSGVEIADICAVFRDVVSAFKDVIANACDWSAFKDVVADGPKDVCDWSAFKDVIADGSNDVFDSSAFKDVVADAAVIASLRPGDSRSTLVPPWLTIVSASGLLLLTETTAGCDR